MSEKRLEKSEMSSVDFASTALQRYVAPKGSGINVKDRITKAARRLGWSVSRTKDVWYADPRVSISAEELRVIEEAAGVKYGRAQIRTIDDLISRADALLDGPNADYHRPFVDAFRAFIGALGVSDRP
ncbi:hypothetical protein EXN61_11350 [Agrobacterium tumefaciens]|uniref:Uncharacterized protein n=1 Tax=Agrobacterium tumefaciens TaxID=358 RepID=A0A546XYJ9_AGRTU|nr:hypothetical protein [Agrobacterium tumefaciens]TRB05824.1 hypothetical protein EXN61_11350 [Agrobacterium tumefaciens]